MHALTNQRQLPAVFCYYAEGTKFAPSQRAAFLILSCRDRREEHFGPRGAAETLVVYEG